MQRIETAISLGLLVACGALLAGCGARTDLDAAAEPEKTVTGLRFGRLGATPLQPTMRLEAFLAKHGGQVERIFEDSGETITEEALAPFDVVIVEAPKRGYDGVESGALRTFVTDGGGLLVTSGYRVDLADQALTNSLVQAFAVTFDGDLINDDVTDFATHPTTKGVATLPFLGGFRVDAVVRDASSAEEVAFVAGAPVGVAYTEGRGRAFFWGDEWIEFDDEWSDTSDTPKFWRDLVRWLARQD